MKTMIDGNGQAVPIKYVSKFDKARDAATRRILARFLRARKNLEALVNDSLHDLDALKESREILGQKGNFQASSFDGNVQVSVRQSYRIKLDDRVAKARELMLEYARHLAGQVAGNDGAALLQIISAAFEANRDGILPYAKVLALMRLEIHSAAWEQAKKLLAESIQPEKGKAYLACQVRPDHQHDFSPIRLDIADCWPKEGPKNDAASN